MRTPILNPTERKDPDSAELGAQLSVFTTTPKARQAFLFMAVIAGGFGGLGIFNNIPPKGDAWVALVASGLCLAVAIWLVYKAFTLRHLVIVHELGLFIDTQGVKPLRVSLAWAAMADARIHTERINYNGGNFDTRIITISMRDGRTYSLADKAIGDLETLFAQIGRQLA